MKVTNGLDLQGQGIKNLATPTADADGVPKSFIRYDLLLSASGKPAAGERLIDHIAPLSFSVPALLANTKAKARTAATASSVFSLRKNGTEFATITFAAGSTTGTLAGTATSFAVNDILELIAPSTQDSTLSDLSFTIVCLR